LRLNHSELSQQRSGGDNPVVAQTDGSTPSKVIRLRYPATCLRCGIALPVSTRASWDAAARSVTCLDCLKSADAQEPATQPDEPDSEVAIPPSHPTSGQAGASAQREYERRHQKREAQIDQRWGRLAGVVKFLSEDPQSMRAWQRGSEGERRLAEGLTRRVGDRAVLLHDRKVPKSRGNIDHIAIAASGIWVIDAKTYKGKVERRDKGGWFKTDLRLYVGGRNRTKLVDGLDWQVDAVHKALGDEVVPIHAVLCFIDAEWSFFAKPFRMGGVWVTWGRKLAEMIAEPGELTREDVLRVADRLVKGLPSASPLPGV
jgi:hypothetical protein